MERGGFAKLEPRELSRLTGAAVDRYMAETLPDFDKRDERFKYLFRRLRTSTASAESRPRVIPAARSMASRDARYRPSPAK